MTLIFGTSICGESRATHQSNCSIRRSGGSLGVLFGDEAVAHTSKISQTRIAPQEVLFSMFIMGGWVDV